MNYGLQLKPIQSDHYVLGAFTSLPKVILQPDGQWDKDLPVYEPQADKWETWGCTVWGTHNAYEILFKRLFRNEINADERYTYNCVGLDYPGGDPHDACESIRKDGLTFGLLPIPDTFDEFKTPRPMTSDILEKGRAWKYKFGHEWVNTDVASMKEALRYSPLGVSVTAWHEEDGIYIDNGLPNNHWCVCYGYTEANGKVFWKIFDSYDHSLKILHPDHKIQVAKRFHIERVVLPKLSWWQMILVWIKKIYE